MHSFTTKSGTFFHDNFSGAEVSIVPRNGSIHVEDMRKFLAAWDQANDLEYKHDTATCIVCLEAANWIGRTEDVASEREKDVNS